MGQTAGLGNAADGRLSLDSAEQPHPSLAQGLGACPAHPHLAGLPPLEGDPDAINKLSEAFPSLLAIYAMSGMI